MGSLAQTVTLSAANANLTTIGAVDWADWDGTNSTLVATDFKSGGGHTIANPTLLGGAVQAYTGDARTLNWTDGTNTGTSSNNGGEFNNGGATGNGFQIVLPADTNTRTTWLYVGGFDLGTPATVTCSLSDGSASPQTDSTTLAGSAGTSVDGLVKLVYAANSASQSLTVQFKINANTGNVTLQGVAIQSSVPPAASGATYWTPSPTAHPGRSPGAGSARFYQSPKSYFIGGTNVTVGLTGISFGFSAGTIIPSTSPALTGLSLTSTTGTEIPSDSVPLAGSSITSSAGTSTPSPSPTLTGISAAFSSGLLSPSSQIPLNGQAATFATGSISAGGNVTQALTGQSMSFVAGNLTPSLSIPMTGIAISAAQGTLTPSTQITLAGQSLALSNGTLLPSLVVGVLGSSATCSTGTPVATPSVGLTGVAITSSSGTDSPSTDVPLVGQVLTFGLGIITQTGGTPVQVTSNPIAGFVNNTGYLSIRL